MLTQLKPLFSFYGTKGKIAPQYPEPQFDTIIEPFAGGGGYSLLYADHDVHLFDLDEYVVATWDYLIQASGDDIMSLPLTDEFHDTHELPVSLGARCLIGYWCNPASAQPKRTPSQRNKWDERTRQRIAESVDSISHWTVTRSSYVNIVDERATWFIDPPYQQAGKWYRHGSGAIDFRCLGDWCQSRSGQVVVCENDGADWLPFEYLCDTNGMSGKSKEVIWTNET